MVFRFTLSHEIEGSLILMKDPDGWKDLEVIVKRGLEYHGTFYETMVQLEFSCGSGKEFIDNIYELYGVDAVINILIQISCTGSGSNNISSDYSDDYSDDYGSISTSPGIILFETFYEGVLDLGKYNRTSRTTSCDLIQSDFIKKVINRFSTTVELTQDKSLDDIAVDAIADFPSTVTLHSKAVILQVEFEGYSFAEDKFVVPTSSSMYACLPFSLLRDEMGGAGDSEAPLLKYLNSASAAQKDTYLMSPFFTNTTTEAISFDVNYNINATFKFTIPVTHTFLFRIILNYDNAGDIGAEAGPSQGTLVTLYEYASETYTGGVEYTKTIDISGIQNILVNSGRMAHIYIIFPNLPTGGGGGLFQFEYIHESFNINWNYVSEISPSTASLFKIYETGEAITQRITSQNDVFRSNLLGRKNSEPRVYDENGCFSFAGILNGKHARGLSSPLFCSMDDYFRSINSYYPCGVAFQKEGDNYVLILEEREYFYDNSEVILQCPFANKIKMSVAKEYYFTEFIIGYQKWEVENVNGLDEINSKRTFSTGIKALENKTDLESRFIGGMYALEFTRRKGTSTTDSSYDDDNFIVCLNRSVNGSGIPNSLNIAEKAENFPIVNDVLEPSTSYNLRISPVRNMLRHMKYVASSIYKQVGKVLKFTYGEGNYDASTALIDAICANGNYGGEVLSEKQDIAWDDVNEPQTPVYIPEYLEFEYPLSFSQYLEIKNNTYKCIEVSEGNSTFMKGFIIEIRWKPVGGLAYFKLLRSWQ